MARQPDPAVRSRWQSLLDLQPRSGLTVVQFCDSHGVSTASFYQWRRRLREQPPADPAFVPVRVSEVDTPGAVIRVRFDCGAVAEIPGNDSRAIAAVIGRLLNAEAQPGR